MKWLRSLVTFNLITWLGVLVLGVTSAFVVQAFFRVDQVFRRGLNPFSEYTCTIVSPWSASSLGNALVIALAIFGTALLIWSCISFIRVTLSTRRVYQWVQSLRVESTIHGFSIDLIDVDGPLVFCYGLLRPRIAVSQMIVDSLPVRELSAMIQHEMHHQQSRDPLKLFVMQWLEQTFFFIPGFRDLVQLFRLSMEMEADETIPEPNDLRRALLYHIGLRLENQLSTESLPSIAYFSVTEARLSILIGHAPDIRNRKLMWGIILPIILISLFIFFGQSSEVFAEEYRVVDASCQQNISPYIPPAEEQDLFSQCALSSHDSTCRLSAENE